MNTAPKTTRSSLSQRIAQVRNCILVEGSIDISANDKDLFVSLWQPGHSFLNHLAESGDKDDCGDDEDWSDGVTTKIGLTITSQGRHEFESTLS